MTSTLAMTICHHRAATATINSKTHEPGTPIHAISPVLPATQPFTQQSHSIWANVTTLHTIPMMTATDSTSDGMLLNQQSDHQAPMNNFEEYSNVTWQLIWTQQQQLMQKMEQFLEFIQ